MKTGLILGYVPVEVKTQEFYYGMLDGMKILSTVTDAVVPSRFKTAAYYRKMAEHDLSLVPARFYSYEILHAAVCSTEGKNFITDPQFFKPLSVYLDDMLADRLMEKHPYMFGELPKRFKTPERLVIAIDNSKRETNCYIDEETEQSLLSVEVCKAFIRRNGNCPEFPENVWTREFVDYCMEHGTSFRWFRQMPKKFQSSANTQAAYDYGHYHICDFAKRFITPQMAKECYQERSYAHAIPGHFLTEFCRQTGLPEKFYGGETTMLSLKNSRDDYTYCKVGNTCLAFYPKRTIRAVLGTSDDDAVGFKILHAGEGVRRACRNLPPHVAGKDRGGKRPPLCQTPCGQSVESRTGGLLLRCREVEGPEPYGNLPQHLHG